MGDRSKRGQLDFETSEAYLKGLGNAVPHERTIIKVRFYDRSVDGNSVIESKRG